MRILFQRLKTVSIVILLLIFSISTGCSLIKLKQETSDLEGATVIVGLIGGEFERNGPIIVAACSVENGMEVVNHTVLHESGEYELGVYQGSYYIFAYQDQNSNLIYDAGEPAGEYGDQTFVEAPEVGVVYDININIPLKSQNLAVSPGKIISKNKPEKLYSRQAGVVTDLDDKRFSVENGKKGFWEPGSFFETFGGTIYFLKEYDPDKIPILFIHGASGTPREWKDFVKNLDESRFQPWFFYYPSGLRIDSMAYLLHWKLYTLQAKYQFNTIYFTAHSMGGLVARSFIVNYFSQFPYVKLFISLATPWGGVGMADYGVNQSPVVIPSWHDMQPEGDFIKSLYRKKLPAPLAFYVFYGYKGNRNPFQSSNDGTINLTSLLDHRPQSEAEMSYAFNEDHTSILISEKVIEQYNATLNTFYEKDNTSAAQSGGYLQIHFSYDYDFKGVKPRLALVLHPTDQKGGEIVTFFNERGNGKVIGPFPAGKYEASMITMAAKTTKTYTPVTVENSTTHDVQFVFKPDGEIRGCVSTVLNDEDKFIGRPDVRYRAADADIHITSISLEGNGINRSLIPVKGPEKNELLPNILRRDGCYNNCFGFFGLTEGKYTLFIEADGYQPVEKRYHVIPGKPQYFRLTELTAE